jgi:hypothetical protein
MTHVAFVQRDLVQGKRIADRGGHVNVQLFKADV